MPPRKSNVSIASAPVSAPAEKVDENGDGQNGISVDDLSLPRSMVQRLAKGVLPANTQIQKDALLALHRSATVFVNYLASHANENTFRTGKKTIQPSDVFEALRATEFEHFLPRLESEYTKFTSMETDKRNSYRKKVKEEKLAAAVKFAHENTVPTSPHDRSADANGHSDPAARSDDSPPAAKRARRDDDAMDGTDAEDEIDLPDDAIEEDVEDEPEEEIEEDEGSGGDEEEEGEEDLVEDPLESADRNQDDNASDGDDSD